MLRLPGGQQQPVADHRGPHPGAGLGVGAVRGQLEVVAERLALVVGAHPAGEVGAPGHGPGHLPLHRLQQRAILALHCGISGTGREVQRPDRMPAQHLSIADRDVVLEVLRPEPDLPQPTVPTAFQEQHCLVQVPALSCAPGQLHQSRFDLRVPADPVQAAGTKHLADMVSRAQRHLHELVPPPGTPPCDTSLDEVPEAVQLVPVLQVAVSRRLPCTTKVGVQVAIGLLHRQDPCGQRLEAFLQADIPGAADLPGHRLHQLVHVRVGELPTGAVRRQPALSGRIEVADPAHPLHPVLRVVDHDGGVQRL